MVGSVLKYLGGLDQYALMKLFSSPCIADVSSLQYNQDSDTSGKCILCRLYRDIQVVLACIRGLPSDNVGPNGVQKSGELDEFLLQRFGVEPPP